MNAEISTLINRIAPRSHVHPEAIHTNQLSLFPELRAAPEQPDSAEDIRLPRSVLLIGKDEQLSKYLSRVAATAMLAATRRCGSPAKAPARLGTFAELVDQQNNEMDNGSQYSALRLAANNSSRVCELEQHVYTSEVMNKQLDRMFPVNDFLTEESAS